MKKTTTGNFNPKRITHILEYKNLGKLTTKDFAKEFGISYVQAYVWCNVSPLIFDKLHKFCKKYNVTFEELYKMQNCKHDFKGDVCE